MSEPTSGRAVVIFGPPASGKSTITRQLEHIDSRYRLFPRLKAGSGRANEYRISTLDRIKRLQAAGEVIWTNERYGAVYVIDRPYLQGMLKEGRIPVLHVGQLRAVEAIVTEVPDVRVTTVSLTCPRETAIQRIIARETGDTSDRIEAFDASEKFIDADLAIDTSIVSPAEAADLIVDTVSG